MDFFDLLQKHLSPRDFDRMTAYLGSMPEQQRVDMVRFITERETKAPAPGDQAPDFELPLIDNPGTMRLASFRGKRPVSLIFGSFT